MSVHDLFIIGMSAVVVGFIYSFVIFTYAFVKVVPAERVQLIGEGIKTFLFSLLSLILLLGAYYL